MTPTEIRETIERLGLNQVQAANVLGVTPRCVRFWLSGQRKIPKYLGVVLPVLEAFYMKLKKPGEPMAPE